MSHLAFFAHANVFHLGGHPVPIELPIASIPEDGKDAEVICITVDHSNLVMTSKDSRANSGTGLEPVTKQATVRYLYHSATAATEEFRQNKVQGVPEEILVLDSHLDQVTRWNPGVSHSGAQRNCNPELRVGSNFQVVEEKATDYVHLKQALTEQFPVFRNTSELETRFYVSYHNSDQRPSEFVYDLLKIHKHLKLDMVEEKLLDHFISHLEPQIWIMWRRIGGIPELTTDNMSIADRRGNPTDLEVKVLVIIGGSIVDAEVVALIIDSVITVVDRVVRGTVLSGVRMVKTGKSGSTHVLYHEIDTGDQGPVVSRPNRYDRFKQGIIDYHIQKMLKEGTIRPIQSPYASAVVLPRKNNGLSPEAYPFAIDYRKLNAITKYPRYQLPLIDKLITNISYATMMTTHDLKSGYFQLAINPRDIEKKPRLLHEMAPLRLTACHLAFQGQR
ncbi:retrovirus-related Pol polyprotein from transposon 17.6 [Trichonephila clavipes]|nr:retrovirus-related Pol polyprotein from transposon 17.6 [Trichonephila clavipes]